LTPGRGQAVVNEGEGNLTAATLGSTADDGNSKASFIKAMSLK
jgi:hypothetical protein